MAIVIRGMHGLGDTLIQLEFACKMAKDRGGDVYYQTSWPQLMRMHPDFEGSGMKLVMPEPCGIDHSDLNAVLAPYDCAKPPGVPEFHLHRSDAFSDDQSFYETFRKRFKEFAGNDYGGTSQWLDVPEEIIDEAHRKFEIPRGSILVRLPTIHLKTNFYSRLPDMDVFDKVVAQFPGAIGIGRTTDSEFVYHKPSSLERVVSLPDSTTVEDLVGLWAGASAVICTVSFAQQLACYVDTPCLTVYGGHLKPETILDDRQPTLNHVTLAPNMFCHCDDKSHECDKSISDEDLTRAVSTLRARIPRPRMIHVTGMPRSGTTWMQEFLCSHKDIEIAGEDRIAWGDHWAHFCNLTNEYTRARLLNEDERPDLVQRYSHAGDPETIRKNYSAFLKMFWMGGRSPQTTWGVKSVWTMCDEGAVGQWDTLFDARWIICLKDPFESFVSHEANFPGNGHTIDSWLDDWVKMLKVAAPRRDTFIWRIDAPYNRRLMSAELDQVLEFVGHEPTTATRGFAREFNPVNRSGTVETKAGKALESPSDLGDDYTWEEKLSILKEDPSREEYYVMFYGDRIAMTEPRLHMALRGLDA